MSETEKTPLLQPVDDEVRTEVKSMIRTARAGALALLAGEPSWPSVSRVGLATDIDGAPVFPMSDLSGRASAVDADNRASLLIGEVGKGDPLAQKRVAVYGRLKKYAGDDHTRVRDRYLARHPKAKLYIDFKDFSLWRFEIERASFIGGFGRAYSLSGEDLAEPMDALAAWGYAELSAREHMNDDHADAVLLYARGLADAPAGAWRLAGIDPEGIDLVLGDDHRRVHFKERLSGPGEVKAALIDLLGQARENSAGSPG